MPQLSGSFGNAADFTEVNNDPTNSPGRGNYYYIFNRGNNGETIFRTAENEG